MSMQTSSPQNLILSLVAISKSIKALLSLRLAQMSLELSGAEILMVLSENVVLTAPALVQRLQVRPERVARTVDILCSRGLTSRIRDDRKQSDFAICLTPHGITVRSEVMRLWTDLETELATGTEHAERETVSSALSTLQATIDAKLVRVR